MALRCLVAVAFFFCFLQQGRPASFYGDSYINIPFSEASTTINLELRFKTSRPNGVLFLAKGNTDFFYLHLNKGLVEARCHFGTGNWTLKSASSVRFDDQSWHHVTVKQTGREITVTVDGLKRASTIPSELTQLHEDQVFVGGLKKEIKFSEKWSFFRGCIGNVMFNKYDILRNAQQLQNANAIHHISWDCKQEFTTLSSHPIHFYTDKSYAAFPHLHITSDGTFSLDVKTKTPTALLVFNMNRNKTLTDLFALELVNGKVKQTINRGHSDLVIQSNIVINDDRWHHIHVTFDARRVILEVDLERQYVVFDSKSRGYFVFSGHLLVGGATSHVHQHALKRNLTSVKQATSHFKGCIKNINVNSHLIGFQEMQLSHGLDIHCPVGGHCRSNPCKSNARCLEVGDTFTCECATRNCLRVAEVAPDQGDTQAVDESEGSNDVHLVQVRSLKVREGGQKLITTNEIQVLFDFQRYKIRESAIQFSIKEMPKHGKIIINLNRRRNSNVFTLLDVIGKKVFYRHGGSETVSDSVTIEMILVVDSNEVPSRLTQTFAFVLPIEITAVDDRPILLLLNTSRRQESVSVAANKKLRVTNKIIDVYDPDTPPDKTVLSVTCTSTVNGYVSGHFERSNSKNQSITNFTMKEINDGQIWFSSTTTGSNCQISVSGDSKTLKLNVVPVQLHLMKNSGLRLTHGSFAFVEKGNLSAKTNLPYQELEIRYNIIRQPMYGEIQRQLSSNGTWSTVTTFAQRHVDKGLIRYQHTSLKDLTEFDQFTYVVKCLEKSLQQTFYIQFDYVTLDVVTPRTIQVHHKDYKILTSSVLTAETNNKQMQPTNIKFTLLRPPVKGSIFVIHHRNIGHDSFSEIDPLNKDGSFTQQEVNSEYVIYKLRRKSHERFEDFFDLKIEAPPALSKMTRLRIEFIPENLRVKFTNNLLENVIEGGQRAIEKNDLYLETDDYSEFEFNIINFPRHGILELVDPRSSRVMQRNISKFTNNDIRNLRLVYRHDNSEMDKDMFTFIATPIVTDTNQLPAKVQEFSGTFQIKMLMRNDNKPVQVVQKVFNVVTNSARVVTLNDMAFTDPDLAYDPMDLLYRRTTISNGDFINTENKSSIFEFTQRDIAEGKVTFKHTGAEYGRALMLVTDGQYYTRFLFEVQAQSPYIKVVNNTGIIVKSGQSVVISTFNFSTESNFDKSLDEIRVVLIEEPLYGRLKVKDQEVTEFTMQDVADGQLVYEHKGKGGVEDKFKFAIVSGEAQVQGQFPIQIYLESQQQPPRIVHNSILQVSEKGSAVITKDNLLVTHPSSRPADITYTVTAKPNYGRLYLSNQGQRGQQSSASLKFSQEEINQGILMYHHSLSSTAADFFSFEVTNGIQSLKGLQFAIEVVPSTLELEIQNFTVREGSRKALTPSYLKVKTRYFETKPVTFTIVQQPRHGWIESVRRRGEALSSFTSEELQKGRIYFVHDNSELPVDQISFKARIEEDKKESKEGVMFIVVQQINDQPPRVTVNRGLNLWKGALALLSKEVLLATDPDSPPERIIYRVTKPTNGKIALLNNTFKDITSFTQAQINAGQIVFVHEGGGSGSFYFYVTDGVNGDLQRLKFQIMAHALKLTVVQNSPLKVYPSRSQVISRENLYTRTNDRNQSKSIIYHIQQKPKKGRIVTMFNNRPMEVTSFKQQDINDGRILYEHQSYTQEWTDADFFLFEVGTLYADPIENEVFDIEISYSNLFDKSQNSFVKIQGFVVEEGGEKSFSKKNLDVSEYVNQLQTSGKRVTVTYALVTLPQNGELKWSNVGMKVGNEFSQDNINLGEINYVHDDSDTTKDHFKFKVVIEIEDVDKSREVREVEATFNISVVPVNDQPFQLVTTNPVIQVTEGMNTLVTSDILKTVDPDTPPSGIQYEITVAPSNGILGFQDNPMYQISRFTQKDLDDKNIVFTQYGRKVSDNFHFRVSDGKFPYLNAVVSVRIVSINLEIKANQTINILQADTSVYITKENLDVKTNGIREKVLYNITQGPKFGEIFLQMYSVLYFDQGDIDNNNVLYIQRNLTSYTDDFYCDIYYEGSNVILHNRRIVIAVKPLVKQKPIRATLKGEVAITTINLDASRLANITGHNPEYVLIEKPKYGNILKRVFGKREVNYRDGPMRSSYKNIDKFTHEDVVYVKIFYVANDLPFQESMVDSFAYLLSARGVQPALGVMKIELSPSEPFLTTSRTPERPKVVPSDPTKKGNVGGTSAVEREPKKGEIVSPSVSSDFIIILAILIPLFVLVILVVVVVFILWRKQRYRNYAPPSRCKHRPRPQISGPVAVDQPHVHIEPQQGVAPSSEEDDRSLVFEHHNYYNVPVINARSNNNDSDSDDDVSYKEDVTTSVVDPNMTEVSATVPECKVTPLSNAEESDIDCKSPARSSKSSVDLFDWSLVEDPEFLQHCRTSAPVLRDSQYWV